jgi:hypothetical protein
VGVVQQVITTTPAFSGNNPPDPASNPFAFPAATNPFKQQAATGGWFVEGDSDGSVGTKGFRTSAGAAGILTIAHKSSAIAVANGTDVQLTLDTEDFDGDGLLASNAWTCPATATYRVTVNGWWTQNNTGRRLIRVNRNSTTVTGGFVANVLAQDSNTPVAGEETGHTGVFIMNLTAGDVMRVWLWQNSGGSLNFGGPGAWPMVSFERISV